MQKDRLELDLKSMAGKGSGAVREDLRKKDCGLRNEDLEV